MNSPRPSHRNSPSFINMVNTRGHVRRTSHQCFQVHPNIHPHFSNFHREPANILTRSSRFANIHATTHKLQISWQFMSQTITIHQNSTKNQARKQILSNFIQPFFNTTKIHKTITPKTSNIVTIHQLSSNITEIQQNSSTVPLLFINIYQNSSNIAKLHQISSDFRGIHQNSATSPDSSENKFINTHQNSSKLIKTHQSLNFHLLKSCLRKCFFLTKIIKLILIKNHVLKNIKTPF